MAEVNIDLKMVAEIASGIRKNKKSLSGALESLNMELEKTGEVWRDSTQNDLVANAKGLKEKTTNFLQDLDAYAAFLENVAGEYAIAEEKINKNIESFS